MPPTVFVMHAIDFVYELPTRMLDQIEVGFIPSRGCCDPWTREFGEGMKHESVDYQPYGPQGGNDAECHEAQCINLHLLSCEEQSD